MVLCFCYYALFVWIAVAFFMAIKYNSVLQISVVVPQVLQVDLSFDDMVKQNFPFVSVHHNFIGVSFYYARH